MNRATGAAGGPLVELDENECWKLIGDHTIARIAWQGSAGPTVIPVNYAFDGDRFRIRTAAYSAMARECDDTVVAIEVDQVDEQERSGWSVLVRGHCHIEFDQPRHGDTGAEDAEPWPTGHHPLQLVIEPSEVHGRRIA